MSGDPLRYFRIEARELIDQISQGVLDLDQAPGPEPVARLLRLAHTLKGAARVVRQGEIADRAHATEDILVPHRDGATPLTPAGIGRLLQLADEISAAVAVLTPPAPDGPAPHGPAPHGPAPHGPAPHGPAPHGPASGAPAFASAAAAPAGASNALAAAERPDATASVPPASDGEQHLPGVVGAQPGPTAAAAGWPGAPGTGTGTGASGSTGTVPAEAPTGSRPGTSDVDQLLEAVSETHARLVPLLRATATVERARGTADALADQLRGRLTEAAPQGADRSAHHPARAAAVRLTAELAALGRRMTDTVDQVERELGEVRTRAERLRLVAAASIFTSLHRAVRDVAEAQGKRVVFDSRGGELRLDPQILAQVSSALLHVVRNAVAHGIEPEPERRRIGKPAEGRVTVEVVRRGRYAAFRCCDDGRGVDLAAVRRAAEANGLLPSGITPAPADLVDLLLRGGISTTDSVTEVSGRGIGLDVVRDVAEQLGGDVSASTQAGTGTTVELVVPLSLLWGRGLVVQADATTVHLPLEAVQTCVRLSPEQHADARLAAALPHAGRVIPFLALSAALAAAEPAQPAAVVAVVISSGRDLAALGVQRLLGTPTMVVRPLPDLTPADPVVGGITLDAEGHARLVLDPDAVVARVRRMSANGGSGVRTVAPAAASHPILVIDDSLTTRMLERSILESAGYQVELAASGEEALDKARSRRHALFLTDIDMPGIDGFTFVELTRADPELCDTPAILVSSRASADDRRRGAQVGASAYVVKSEFDQAELLGLIESLVPAPGAVR